MHLTKRYRLLACVVVLPGMLAAGFYARVAGGVPSDLPDGRWIECRLGGNFGEPFYTRADLFVVLGLYFPWPLGAEYLPDSSREQADYLVRTGKGFSQIKWRGPGRGFKKARPTVPP